jgi:hypothetical protein
MKKTPLPLIAVSYLQTLANGNPKMVANASNYFYALRDQYDQKKISQEIYLCKIKEFIQAQIRED